MKADTHLSTCGEGSSCEQPAKNWNDMSAEQKCEHIRDYIEGLYENYCPEEVLELEEEFFLKLNPEDRELFILVELEIVNAIFEMIGLPKIKICKH